MAARLSLLLAASALPLLLAVEPTPLAPVPVDPVPAQPEPLTAIPATARMVLRLVDHQRAQLHWEDSPFPALMATRWGTALTAESAKRPSLYLLLVQLALADQATMGIDMDGQFPQGHILATATDPQPLAGSLSERQPPVRIEGSTLRATLPLQIYHIDRALRQGGPGPAMEWTWYDLLPVPAAALAVPIAPTVDADLCWNQRATWAPGGALCRAAWTIEPFGLREHLQIGGCPAVGSKKPVAVVGKPAVGKPAAEKPVAEKLAADKPVAAIYTDRAVFSGLPPATIWALSCGHLPTLLARVPLANDALAQVASGLGLGAWDQLAPQLGSVLIRTDQGAPLPALTIELEMPEDLGRAVLNLLDVKHQFSADPDGTHLGVIGFVPMQAGWREGRLVLTTLSGGVAAAVARPGGFLDQPGISDAMKELPAGDLLLAGLSRSAESWSALTALAPWLARRKPELGSLSADLRKAGKFGFLAVRREDDVVRIDAGGLCGGPLSTSAMISGFLHLSFPRDERRQRPEAEPQEKPVEKLEVKPKQIEF